MDTIQINITETPNEVTINVSNLQGPPGPSGATATLQEVVNNGNIVEFEFAKSPLGISKFFISDSAVNMQCNDGPGHGVVVASGGGVTLSGSNDNTGQSSTLEVAPGAIHAVAVDGEAKIETYSAGMGVDFNGLRTFVNKVWLYFTDMGLNWGQVKMDAAETTISHTQKIALNSPSVQKNGYEVATENYVTLENARTNANTIAGDINANSNTLINLRDAVAPKEPITKMQFDTYVSAVGGQRGSIDCSTNPNYPASNKGDRWEVTVAGKIGGALGIDVQVYDEIVCKTTSVAGDQATVGANFYIVQGNLERATETVAGYIQLATDVETQAGTENTKAITALKLDNWWTNIKTLAQTFAAKITFLTSPRISSGTASTVPYLDANKDLVSSSVTPTQLGYLDATSSIQTQLNEIRQGRKYFAYNNTTYSYTGTTASTILRTIYIPANSMNINSTLELHAIFGKSGTAGTMNYAAYITTNPSVITGGSVVKINAFAAGYLQGGFVLRLTNKNSLNSQAVQLANSGANQYDSWQLTNFARTLLSIDFAVDQYLHIYSTLGNATDTAIIYDYQCYIDKN